MVFSRVADPRQLRAKAHVPKYFVARHHKAARRCFCVIQSASAMRRGTEPRAQLSFIASADPSATACVRCADVLRPLLLGGLSEQTDALETASRREVSLGRPLEVREKHLRLPAP